RRACTGIRNFNEFARKSDGERKARSGTVEHEIPAIIDQATFEAVKLCWFHVAQRLDLRLL
ncbi:MAG TPA: hypothetical protein VN838_31410, partial [Bradyrhizobium sp.]|nr:hypothetical protein [Bradyrhizobium sp.]